MIVILLKQIINKMLVEAIVYLTPLNIECLDKHGTIFAEGKGYQENIIYKTNVGRYVKYNNHILYDFKIS